MSINTVQVNKENLCILSIITTYSCPGSVNHELLLRLENIVLIYSCHISSIAQALPFNFLIFKSLGFQSIGKAFNLILHFFLTLENLKIYYYPVFDVSKEEV